MEYCCYRAVRWNSNLLTVSGSSSGVRTLPQASFRSHEKLVSEGTKRGDNRSADAKIKRQTGHFPSIKGCVAGLGNKQAKHLHEQEYSISLLLKGQKKQKYVSHIEQSQTCSTVWVGMNLKDHLTPTPLTRAGNFPLDRIVLKGLFQPSDSV